MGNPTCNRCEKELADWQGNVLVDNRRFTFDKTVDDLEVVCKQCTRAIANTELHNIWELRWVRDSYIRLLASVIEGVTNPASGRRWSKQAAEKFWNLGVLAFPDKMKDPLDD